MVMKSLSPIPIVGNPASPYTRKMVSLLRYRRIPYSIKWGDPRGFLKNLKIDEPKPILLPVTIFEVDGEEKAVCDSTPIIRHLETEFSKRSVIPSNPALAFLNYVLEDFGDEWVTKYMFHYRWNFKDDIENASTRLPLLHDMNLDDQSHREFKKYVADWQTNRLWVVGSNEITAPIIEASYKRFLEQLEESLARHSFLFGKRPSSADYAIYGQLTQLIGFDPTSRSIACDRSPRVISWLDLMEDMSGLEPKETDWLSLENALGNLGSIFHEIGRVYIPALLANAQGIASKAESWETQIDGAIWEQKCFPYQAKCFKWINDEFNALNENDQSIVSSFLSKTGCKKLILKD